MAHLWPFAPITQQLSPLIKPEALVPRLMESRRAEKSDPQGVPLVAPDGAVTRWSGESPRLHPMSQHDELSRLTNSISTFRMLSCLPNNEFHHFLALQNMPAILSHLTNSSDTYPSCPSSADMKSKKMCHGSIKEVLCPFHVSNWPYCYPNRWFLTSAKRSTSCFFSGSRGPALRSMPIKAKAMTLDLTTWTHRGP